MFVTGTANDGLLDPISAVCTKLYDIRAAAVKLRLQRDATPPPPQSTRNSASGLLFLLQCIRRNLPIRSTRWTSLVVVFPEDASFFAKGQSLCRLALLFLVCVFLF